MHHLPTLTVNRPFMKTFLSSPSPCAAFGIMEERGEEIGFLTMRSNQIIPDEVSHRGFNFGHSLLDIEGVPVIQFAFEFYDFDQYYVLMNPNNPIVQAVLTKMMDTGTYFFLALNPDDSVLAFKANFGQDDIAGLRTSFPAIQRATTTDEQYNKALFHFSKNPEPAGKRLNWACRGGMNFLDLTTNRWDLNPSS